jgi:hypothetical protein
MNPEPAPNDRPPRRESLAGFQQEPSTLHFDARPLWATTITYFIEEQPGRFSFVHDNAKAVYVLSRPDGTVERFRAKPARYLVVEPDPNTGGMRPAVRGGQPVFLYLCREEREV